jgi:hypothetical protein
LFDIKWVGEHRWPREQSIEERLTTQLVHSLSFSASTLGIPEIHGIPLGLMGVFVLSGKAIAYLAGVLAWGEENCVARS